MINRFIAYNKLREAWDSNPATKGVGFKPNMNVFTRTQDSLLNAISENISNNMLNVSKPDKKLGIIEVSIKTDDETFSMLFDKQIVANVNDFYIQTKTKKAAQNLQILQLQTDSVRSMLNRAITGMATSIDANPNPNMALQILKVPSQKRQVDAEANKAILTELIKNLEIAKVSLRKETPLIQVIDEPLYPLKKEKLGKTKGILIGGVIGGLITMIILMLKKLYREII